MIYGSTDGGPKINSHQRNGSDRDPNIVALATTSLTAVLTLVPNAAVASTKPRETVLPGNLSPSEGLIAIVHTDGEPKNGALESVTSAGGGSALTSMTSHAAVASTSCNLRLQWLQAEYHHMCVEHRLPPGEDTAAAAIRDKPHDELKRFAIHLVNLMRSAVEGVSQSRNPYLDDDLALNMASQSCNAPIAPVPHRPEHLPGDAPSGLLPLTAARRASRPDPAWSLVPLDLIPKVRAMEVTWSPTASLITTPCPDQSAASNVGEAVGQLLRKASLEYISRLEAMAVRVQCEGRRPALRDDHSAEEEPMDRAMGDGNAAPLLTTVDEVEDEDDAIVQIGDFLLGQVIGRGKQGQVRLALETATNELAAIKLVEKHKLCPSLQRELDIVRRLNHKHIVRAHQCINDPRSRFLYIVMDLAHGPVVDMSQAWKPLPLALLFRKYFPQAVSALQYLHEDARIVHRDIKPDNLLLDRDGNLLLCDFGVAKCLRRDDANDDGSANSGATAYRAPEEFASGGLTCGSRIDIWSLAACFYHLSTGVLPFRGDTYAHMRDNIADPLTAPAFDADAPEELRRDEMWPDWKALLQSMLRKEPKLRVSARWLLRDPRMTRWAQK